MTKNFEQIRQALNLFITNDVRTYKLVERAAYQEAEREGTIDLPHLMTSCFANYLDKETRIFLDDRDVWDLYPEEWFEIFADDFEEEFKGMVEEKISEMRESE